MHSTTIEPVLDLEQVIRRIQEISSLPQVATRVMQVANDHNAGAGELKQVLEFDPALCTRVLRCVNSSAYATRARSPISSRPLPTWGSVRSATWR